MTMDTLAVVIVTVATLQHVAMATDKTVINIIGLFPTSENITEGVIGRGVQPAVELAIDLVNNNTNILKNYELRMHKNDTQCDMAVATKIFFDTMYEGATNAMLFGDACWEVTGPLTQISKWWNMTMLSYADTNPILSNRKTYKNFYRTVPSDSDFNPARVHLLRHYDWLKVGTLYQHVSKSTRIKVSSSRYSYAHANLQRRMADHNISFKALSFADDPRSALKTLHDEDIRIILGNFSPEMARHVFCVAHELGMYGEKHQWIILGGYPDDWWKTEDPDDPITCSREEMEEAIHGYIATDIQPLTNSMEKTESGWTPQQYEAAYNKTRKSSYSKYHGYAFDGVWVMAGAIDRVLKDGNYGNRYGNYTHKKGESGLDLNEAFRGDSFDEQLNATDFLGVTGKVRFRNGDRLGEIMLEQHQYGKMVKIGVYKEPDNLDLYFHKIVWRTRDNTAPSDSNKKLTRILRVGVATYSALTVLAGVGILMALCFLTVNIYFRQHRYIKMSSPNMNNLIIVGCLLTYVSVILLGSDGNVVTEESFHHMCAARSWVMAIGFTLAFGAMFGKTWRVHAIFTNIKLNKKVIKDYKLFAIVGVLLLMDAIILTLWQAIDPLRRDTRNLKSEIKGEIEEIPQLEFCTSTHMTTWMVIMYVYKGILLVIGCFFAWETRHVSIPALNDSKYIGMSVYNVVILCLCGAAVSFIVNDQPNSAFTIVGLFIIFCSTITLCLVFVPKMIELKRDPKGEEKRIRATLSKTTKKNGDKLQDPLSHKIALLRDENSNYRAILDEKTREVRELLLQLGEEDSEFEYTPKVPMNKKIMALRETGNSQLSPSRMSRLSVITDDDNQSTFSETSNTQLMTESPEHSRLKSYLRARTNGTDGTGNADHIELKNIGSKTNKHPPPEPEPSRDKFDPFGGVYLGPADSDDEEEPSPIKQPPTKPRDEYPLIHEMTSPTANQPNGEKTQRSAQNTATFLPDNEDVYDVTSSLLG